jgi:hypothetical protein
MPMQSDTTRFASVVAMVMRTHAGGALLALGVDTFEKLRAKRGFNTEALEDAAVIALLTKMNDLDDKIDMDIDGEDADAIRRLHIKTRDEVQASSAIHGGGVFGQPLTQAAEDAASASKAKELYDRLEETQGVTVPLNEQLDYTLIHQMSSLLTKNGTINKRIGLKNMAKQSEKKKTMHQLGAGLSVNFEEGNADEDGQMKYNEITLVLWTFFRGLAAVLTEEVQSNPDGPGKTLVKDATSGEDVCISGTFQACLTLMFAIVKAIGKYPSRCADGIFRNAFNKVMDLTVALHFDDAVTRAINYHPQAFLPLDEDLEEAKPKMKGGTTGAKRAGPQAASPVNKKKKIDASANPCHGVVYSGVCTKADCQFDHHAGRCKAFKEAHPDGPPRRQ